MAKRDDFVAQALPPRPQWPEMVFTLPDLQYPARLNAVAELLDVWTARGHGDAPCVLGADFVWSYAEFTARVNRICNVLVRELGVVPGQAVLLRGFNSPMLAACILAVIKAGAVAVPTMPMLRAREIAYPMTKARVSVALCDARLAADLEAARPLAPSLQRVVVYGADAKDGLEALMAAEILVTAWRKTSLPCMRRRPVVLVEDGPPSI